MKAGCHCEDNCIEAIPLVSAITILKTYYSSETKGASGSVIVSKFY